MLKSVSFILLLSSYFNLTAQIPAYGNAQKLDIACWNIEWFGDPTYGPTNEVLQFDNILKVLRNTKIDAWGLVEISDNATFSRLLDSLPQYKGLIAPINQTQKTGFLFDTTLFKLNQSKLVMTNESYDFAGRLPFEVSLVPKKGNSQDTFIFLVVHLKANTGTNLEKQESWQRRKNASGHLKNYIDQTHPSKKVIILGDFNDDTDSSIFASNPTPFLNLLEDSTHYQFLTRALTAAQTGSFIGFNNMIDHQIISDELFTDYEANSCKILPLNNFIPSYSSNTSDHYPVFASYKLQQNSAIKEVNKSSFSIFPNPLNALEVVKFENARLLKIMDNNGKEVNSSIFTELSNQRKAGLYILLLEIDKTLQTQKLLVY